MRWFWFDKFVEFHSGRRAVAVKNITMAEDYLTDYIPGHPIMPASLILEGVAQVGGILVGEVNQFRQRIILAKVSRAEYRSVARPGDTLTLTASIENMGSDGAMVAATAHASGECVAEMEIYFAFLNDRNHDRQLFRPDDFLRILRVYRVFEVGKDQDGRPLQIPPWLLEAERTSPERHVP